MLAGTIAHAISPTFAITLGAAICAVAAVIVARLVPPQQTAGAQASPE
jgi:predicted MFS family arabinose efflux permease